METKAVYTTSDGREFSDEEKAGQHERLHKLEEAYESALSKYGRALAETMKTADGCPFSFGVWSYFRPYCQGDHSGVERVTFYPWSLSYDLNEWSETGELSLIDTNSENGKLRRHTIGELYYKESNAQKHLLGMLEERRGWIDDDIAKLEKRLGS